MPQHVIVIMPLNANQEATVRIAPRVVVKRYHRQALKSKPVPKQPTAGDFVHLVKPIRHLSSRSVGPKYNVTSTWIGRIACRVHMRSKLGHWLL